MGTGQRAAESLSIPPHPEPSTGTEKAQLSCHSFPGVSLGAAVLLSGLKQENLFPLLVVAVFSGFILLERNFPPSLRQSEGRDRSDGIPRASTDPVSADSAGLGTGTATG